MKIVCTGMPLIWKDETDNGYEVTIQGDTESLEILGHALLLQAKLARSQDLTLHNGDLEFIHIIFDESY